jgi:hypothetical protein
VLLEGIEPPRTDAFWMTIESGVAQMAPIAPQGRGMARARGVGHRLSQSRWHREDKYVRQPTRGNQVHLYR